MMRDLTLSAGLIAALTFASPAIADGLNLTVQGVRNTQGSVQVLIFDDAKSFERLRWQNAVGYAEIPAQVGNISQDFPELRRGPYAIFVFHDENEDQDLNTSGERLLEGVGASGSSPDASELDFRDAAVRPGDVTIRLFYDR